MKALLIAGLLLSSAYAMAQPLNYTTQKSPSFTDEHNESYLVRVQDDGSGGCYMARSFKGGLLSAAEGFYIDHYDAALNQGISFEFKPEVYPYQRYRMLLGTVATGTTISFIETWYSVKDKAYVGIAHCVDAATTKTFDKELFRIPRKEADAMGSLNLNNIYSKGAKISETSNIAFIAAQGKDTFAIMLTFQGKGNKTFRIYSFDALLAKKLEYDCVKDTQNANVVFKNIAITDGGATAYLLNNVYGDDEDGSGTYELTKVSAQGGQTGRFTNDIKADETLKMQMVNGKLVCAGFYKEPKSKWYGGVSYFEIDPAALAPLKIRHTPFSADVTDGKSGSLLFMKFSSELDFKAMIVTPTGGIVLNAEEYYEVTPPGPNGTGGGQTYYHYDDIISTKFNTDGTVAWIKDINKRQSSTQEGDPYVSYASQYNGNVLSFFINMAEEVKNLPGGKVEFRQTGRNRADLAVIEIDDAGSMTYKKLLDNEDNQVPYMVSKPAYLPGSLIFLGRKGSTKQVLKVSVKE